jgi:hypothetical protein
MKRIPVLCCCLAAGATLAHGTDDVFDRLDEALTWSAAHDQVRARVSGSLDLEGYVFDRPAPGLLRTNGDTLLNPRLTLFLDAQFGPQVYFFAQARADRGFDPGGGGLRGRLDEYALRVTPRRDGLINLQIGKFATVVGNWTARHHSWDNPFITAPLPYENPTGIHYTGAANSVDQLLHWSHVRPSNSGNYAVVDRYRVPILWGPSYASGAAVTGVVGPADYALEVKNSSLSSRPTDWDAARVQWQHPTFSGRVGYRPDESWYVGFSGSAGPYLAPETAPPLAPDYRLDDYRETVWGQDIAYAWHHVQFWAEVYEATFAIPEIGRARTVSYYLEAKYKFTPQLAGAVRWNQQLYGDIPDGAGGQVPWGTDVWRLDLAPSYRFTPHTELKLQYSLQQDGISLRRTARLLAVQFILRL